MRALLRSRSVSKPYNVQEIKVKWSRYRPDVAQRVGTGIALLFLDCDTRRGWVVSSTPRPHFNPGKDPVPILQEAGWAPGSVWTGKKSRPHQDLIPDHPAHSQLLYRLSYPAHNVQEIPTQIYRQLTQQIHGAGPFLLRSTTNSLLLWNSNVHCHIHKSHLLNYILNQFNLVDTFISHFTYSRSPGNHWLGFGSAARPWTCSSFLAKILAVCTPLFFVMHSFICHILPCYLTSHIHGDANM
jgi:hypothetical protein